MKKTYSILFLLLTLSLGTMAQSGTLEQNTKKLVQLLWMVDRFYVDSADINNLGDKALEAMLENLDPHSAYIPQKDVQKMNEPLQGNIIGIGITYQILNDTIHVMDVVADGPAEKVGMMPGDKIIRVNDTASTGDSIKADWVIAHLRGTKGSWVKVDVRRANTKTISFEIKRDNIPLNSIDTWFMIDDKIGYISLRRFAQTSDKEFKDAVEDLKSQGMKKLIFDLRSNGGGYLESAFRICEELLPKDKMVVYTQGSKQNKQEWKTSDRKGVFEKGELVVLTDEYSASASEITSGALQDWDRAVIVGRRTFGKGLVQRPFPLEDGSQVRLTVSRYYIPSGRCIQKPYDGGIKEYMGDYAKRYRHGEMVYADSISFPDSLKYYTDNGRAVYGGGGIMPDIFVPMDTSRASDYHINLRSKNLFNEFSINWTENNREEILKKYPSYEDFDKAWKDLGIMKQFEQYAQDKGVVKNEIKPEWVDNMVTDYLKQIRKDSLQTYNSYVQYADSILGNGEMIKKIIAQAQEEDLKQKQAIEKSDIYIESTLKGFVARNLYGNKYYYKSVQQNDETLQHAVKILRDEKQYNRILKGTKSK